MHGVPLAAGGGCYSFDPEQGPKAVFSRFFGTANPYEALNGEQDTSTGAASTTGTAAAELTWAGATAAGCVLKVRTHSAWPCLCCVPAAALSAHFERLTAQAKAQPGQPQEVRALGVC